MGDCVKSLAEVKADNTHCDPLSFLQWHDWLGRDQIGQAWFPLGESMLTTPNNLLFLHLLNDDLQNELLHHLSRDGGEVDKPIVPWVLLLALFEDWSDIGFSPVLRHLSCPPRPFKDNGERFSNDICQLPQHLHSEKSQDDYSFTAAVHRYSFALYSFGWTGSIQACNCIRNQRNPRTSSTCKPQRKATEMLNCSTGYCQTICVGNFTQVCSAFSYSQL